MIAERGIIFDIMAGRIASRKAGKQKLRYRAVHYIATQREAGEEEKKH